MSAPAEIPNFSPFPKLNPRPPNVPASDDEKEELLERARQPVLNSNDPEMQLAWAQDALAFVAAAQTQEERLAENRPPRPATPAIEHQLRVDATNIVSFLADQHHPRAEFIKGMWLEFGNFGWRQDKREAFRCYARASEKGYYRADYRMGMQFEQNNDPVKALIHYQKGAANGDAASNYRLGMMTLMGQMGQAQDYAKGIQMLKIASAQADENAPQGAYVLGMLQARELPQVTVPEVLLPYNVQEARINIEKAAYLGFAKAQLKMGSAYELCSLGCEFNPALSLHYNALAARQGEPEAEMAISKWFLCGHENIFSKNEQLAYEYAERAAQSGLATAEFAMGYFNEIGVHVPVNIEKARYWYDLAAKNGNQDAVGRIASLDNSQQLSKKDHENIAISKIKSQHGSMRGKRPERSRAQAPGLPSVADEDERTPTGQMIPPRGSSITPYPMNDGPPVVPPVNRPPTVAPYPMDNGPPKITTAPSFGGGFAPELRSHSAAPQSGRQSSGSAFNINPNIYDQGPPNDNYNRPYSGQGGYNQGRPLQRPATTLGDVSPGGHGGYGGGPDGRRYSGPQAGGYGPHPGAGRGGHLSPNARPQQGGPTAPSKLDIGYAGPGGKQSSPNQRPHQGGGDIGYVAPLQPKKQQQTLLDTTSPAGAGYRPPRTDSRPPTSQGHGPGTPVGGRPPRKDVGGPGTPVGALPGKQVAPQKVSGGPPPPAKASTAPAAPGKAPGGAQQPAKAPGSRPPGKGPKTFDEMGVQAGKEQGDCVSSLLIHHSVRGCVLIGTCRLSCEKGNASACVLTVLWAGSKKWDGHSAGRSFDI
jgi:TPR repeat protein